MFESLANCSNNKNKRWICQQQMLERAFANSMKVRWEAALFNGY